VRLAALDLREISGVDLEGPGMDPEILGFLCFHLNSRVLTFLLNVIFLCKFHRIRVLGCASRIMPVTIRATIPNYVSMSVTA